MDLIMWVTLSEDLKSENDWLICTAEMLMCACQSLLPASSRKALTCMFPFMGLKTTWLLAFICSRTLYIYRAKDNCYPWSWTSCIDSLTFNVLFKFHVAIHGVRRHLCFGLFFCRPSWAEGGFLSWCGRFVLVFLMNRSLHCVTYQNTKLKITFPASCNFEQDALATSTATQADGLCLGLPEM